VIIGGASWREGDVLSIDGHSGEVYAGAVAATHSTVPEAAVLLAWAAELGIDIGEGEVRTMVDGPTAPGAGEATRDDAIRALTIKGYVTPDLLAPALGVAPEEAARLLDALAADRIASASGGMFSLTATGQSLAAEMLAADRQAMGPAAADAALDGFIALDGRMKVIVTAWQMKEVGGQRVLNDHTDAAYDADVLARLAALHADADAWLAPLLTALPRLRAYARRLSSAAQAATAGDGRFIASPRVDSYHGVWFELHEDLIRLAGRTREDEVAAGRA
jgi:pyruvate,orthophosphate dikinase